MTVPEDLKYTDQHEWIRVQDDTAVVGITDYAQGELGDIVYVELPAVGTRAEAASAFGVVEAVKTVSDLFSPVSGDIVAVNEVLASDASIVNKSPYEDGWMIKVRMSDPSEVESLLSAQDYRKLIGEES
jgi:glycine cleavage system H protein